MLQKLAALQKNLSSKPTFVTKLFQHIAETLNECWHVEEEQMEDWIDEMVQKFRYMIMHVQNSRTKDNPPAWLLELDLPQWEKKRRPSHQKRNPPAAGESSAAKKRTCPSASGKLAST